MKLHEALHSSEWQFQVWELHQGSHLIQRNSQEHADGTQPFAARRLKQEVWFGIHSTSLKSQVSWNSWTCLSCACGLEIRASSTPARVFYANNQDLKLSSNPTAATSWEALSSTWRSWSRFGKERRRKVSAASASSGCQVGNQSVLKLCSPGDGTGFSIY